MNHINTHTQTLSTLVSHVLSEVDSNEVHLLEYYFMYYVINNKLSIYVICLHNICMCTVYIYYVYINTNTCMYTFKKNVMFIY